MGVDTHLYVSYRYEVEDIKTVLEKHLGCKDAKISGTHTPSMFIVGFSFEGVSRSMYIHHTSLPTGPAIMLSLRHDDQSVRIMKAIGKIIGGVFEDNDCDGKMETIDGTLSDNNGLQYFLKWAVLNNKVPHDTIRELNQAIHEWHDGFKTGQPDRGKYNLYPPEPLEA